LGLALDEPKSNEMPIEVNGLDVLIEDKVRGFADGGVIDYATSSYGEGFTVRTAKSHC